MRVPISWLRDYVDATDHHSVEDLAELLTNAGLEVTAIERLGLEGAELEWHPHTVRLAHVLEVVQHPEADRLVLATVDYGERAPKQVVTGAPNLFAYVGRGDISAEGLMSPIVLEGGTYLDPYKDLKPTKLKAKKLRGIDNDAMLCSPVELGLGEEHDGILLARGIEFSASGEAPAAGTPLVEVLGDAVLEIEIIPNIARCASVVGVAREVAALTQRPLRLPSFDVETNGEPMPEVTIETTRPDLNPRFVALLIRNVEQKPSPLWMQHRLRLAGQRPINAVVDVSNYVMLEMGQPNHTFDWDHLERRAERYAGKNTVSSGDDRAARTNGAGQDKGTVHLITRLAEPGECFTTLDGSERAIPEGTILVTDPAGALSVGAIMGGAESEISPQTTNVLLEAAAWDSINIRRSARLLGLNTEASFRFSRGVHPSQAPLGARRVAELLRRHAGGSVAPGVVDSYPQPAAPVVVALSRDYVNRRSGLDLTTLEIADCLRRLEFDVTVEGETLEATVPDTRLDIEGPHDLLEEVCRMVGYANIPETVLADSLPPQRGNPSLETEAGIQDALAASGFHETITYRLTTPEAEARARAEREPYDVPYVALANPSTQDRTVLRHSVLSSLLDVLASNLRHSANVSLFELGHVYLPDGKSPWGATLPSELPRLALAMTGPRRLAAWDQSAGENLDFFDLKGVVENLLTSLHIEGVAWRSAEHPTFRPGRTAELLIGEHVAGTLGELHPLVVEQLDLRTEASVLAADLDLAALTDAAVLTFKVETVPTHPAIREDLALVVAGDVPEARVRAALLDAGRPLLRDVRLFDVYTGERLGGKKSLAYHLTFQAHDRTLEDKDVEKLRRRILAVLEKEVGATLRG